MINRNAYDGGTRRSFGRRAGLILSILPLLLAGSAEGASRHARYPAVANSPDPDAEAIAWVEATLDELDLRQRVAQLVLPWIRGGNIPRNSAEFRRIRRWIEEDQVGGLIVSRGPAGEFAPMLSTLQAMSRVPLLIVSDLETGPGMRLTGGTNLPPAMAFGAAGREDLAFQAGRLTAAEARAAGIHVTLGPVLDVNSNPRNPIINTRAFGGDPALVARLGAAWIEGAKSGGLLTFGKHFPGHGATEIDSHMELPRIWAPSEQLDTLDLVPFRAAIERGMDGVLVGHIAVPAIDGVLALPASLSAGVITGLLREQLGFDGLVMTDALNMGAITRNYSVAEASIQAILAGADLLLQPPGERDVIDAIVVAVNSGRIPAERIDQSVRRVLLAKTAVGLHTGLVGNGPAPGLAVPGAGIVREVAEASVTLATDRDGLVPLATTARRIVHLMYSAPGTRFVPGSFNAELRAARRNVDLIAVNDRTSAAAFRAVRRQSEAADLVIVSVNLSPREFRPLAVSGRVTELVEELAQRGIPIIIVSFESPYLVEAFPSASTLVLAWNSGAQSQRAAARALLGTDGLRGRLPVSLSPQHGVGTGVTREATSLDPAPPPVFQPLEIP